MKFGESWNRNRYNSLCQTEPFFFSLSLCFLFVCLFLNNHLLTEVLVKRLTTAHDALVRYLPKLENHRSGPKAQTATEWKYSQKHNLGCLLDSATKLFTTDVLRLKSCLEISFIQQLFQSKATAFCE